MSYTFDNNGNTLTRVEASGMTSFEWSRVPQVSRASLFRSSLNGVPHCFAQRKGGMQGSEGLFKKQNASPHVRFFFSHPFAQRRRERMGRPVLWWCKAL